ncbi:MAG: ABC transporter substrate-binding protein [Chloroflexi bacterium]|nr:ABC transporter substrate-binding protein [Chloroflexota bacterium]
MKTVISLSMAILLMASVLVGCAAPVAAPTATPAPPGVTPVAATPKPGGTLTVVSAADFTNMDPGTTTDSASVAARTNIYDGLVDWDTKMQVIPGLAESWKLSADGTTYTFHLRRGVKFQDGTPFNAAAVEFSLNRVIKGEGVFPAKIALSFLSGVKVIDDYTVEVASAGPYAPMLPMLASGPASIVSPEAVKKEGKDFGLRPVGTGPFKFVEWMRGDHLTLEKNPAYWQGAPKVDKVIYRIVPEAAARVTMLRTGEGDVVENVPPLEVDSFKDSKTVNIIKTVSARTMWFRLNMTKKPFDNKLVRQAINYAVDKKKIIDTILRGTAVPADAPMAPADFGYVGSKVYDFNPDKAKQLLKEANFDFATKLVMWAPEGRYVMGREVCEATQAQLQNLGLNVELKVWGDFPAYMKALDSLEFDLQYDGWYPNVTDADSALYQVFNGKYAGQAFNRTKYNNPRVNELLEKGRTTIDPKAREEIYKEVQKIIMDDAPSLFMFYPTIFTGTSSRVRGVNVLPIERIIVKNAWLE